MVGLLAALLVVALLAGLAVWALSELRSPALGGVPARRISARDREFRQRSIAAARWTTAHDEVDGVTRVLLRRSCTGLDGRPEVLEERVFTSFPAQDPLWEGRFTEAMAGARFRCQYLNAEDAQE
ncbi:hypothetical protein [Modestobacter sp. I12A-02662]|uniref:hypothetical protein n=1 Tax=Modestobacter sp. I12A-02662 TaxID=1730496 RepID=UPI0034DF4202